MKKLTTLAEDRAHQLNLFIKPLFRHVIVVGYTHMLAICHGSRVDMDR